MSESFDAAVELDHAEEVYDWCINAADRLGENVPALVRDFFNYRIPAVLSLIRALEAKPTSGPPHLDPRKHDRGPGWGHTQMLDAEHLNDPLPSLGSVHAACTPEVCPTVAGRTPYAEAGIAAEDTSPDAIDAELNGHEPTAFADGGAL